MTARALVLWSLALMLAAPVASAHAQTPIEPGPRRWTVVRVAKWTLLAAAAGFAAYAVSQTSQAEENYEELGRICDADPTRCDLVDGRYADPSLERLFRETADHDQRAQVGIIGAQATLFGSVGLFIWDLRNDRGPQNIPYPSHAQRTAPRGIAIGARIAF